jgi:hypothetical protein
MKSLWAASVCSVVVALTCGNASAQSVNGIAPQPPQISVEDALKSTGADTVYYGTQMRGVSNAKAQRELNFEPRPLEWTRRDEIRFLLVSGKLLAERLAWYTPSIEITEGVFLNEICKGGNRWSRISLLGAENIFDLW